MIIVFLVYAVILACLSSTLVEIPTTSLLPSLLDHHHHHHDDAPAVWILQHWNDHVRYHQKQQKQHPLLFKPITAYIEPPLNSTIPTKRIREELPPRYYEPLPLRTQTPNDLKQVVYPKAKSCKDVPSKLPIDRGFQINATTGDYMVWNVGDKPTPLDFLEAELPHCPVDADPYLPWIHDVFFDNRGSVQFVAQNKRRCNTGTTFKADLERLQPQVALLQPVSVQRIDQSQAEALAPELWQSTNNETTTTTTRYRLVPYEQADKDGQYTRFLCKFHTWSFGNPRIELGETLSEYPFNYEYVAFRKSAGTGGGLLSRTGKDNAKFWTSTLLFSCPLPSGFPKTGSITNNDDTPLLHVDIIPIRVPPRYPISLEDPGYYLNPDLVGPEYVGKFDPQIAWGTRHVLPHVQASGRWENLPVCPIQSLSLSSSDNGRIETTSSRSTKHDDTKIATNNKKKKKKPHLLSACLWASASFRTRGVNKEAITDTKARLMEWIEFHFLVGFDHIYVYDNNRSI
jgi:hypothetical protein